VNLGAGSPPSFAYKVETDVFFLKNLEIVAALSQSTIKKNIFRHGIAFCGLVFCGGIFLLSVKNAGSLKGSLAIYALLEHGDMSQFVIRNSANSPDSLFAFGGDCLFLL